MMALLCYLHREYLDLFDLRRFGKELRGVGHQSSGNGTCEMGFTAHVVGKSVEYGIVLAMEVSVLALQGAFDLGLSALLDTLGTAKELADTLN